VLIRRCLLAPRSLSVVISLGVLVLLPLQNQPSVASASDAQALLNRAAADVNRVRTLSYVQHNTQSSSSVHLATVMRGQEDEVHNREQDREEVTLSARDAKGHVKHIHYTLDIIFVGGTIYWRSSTKPSVWTHKRAIVFRDPFTQVTWQRKRTIVEVSHLSQLAVLSSGAQGAHIEGQLVKGGQSVKHDFYLSGGSNPYVVKDVVTASQVIQGKKVQAKTETDYGPFNTTLVIVAPSTTSGA